ncbi:hypothetical protein CEXT_56581 [Caerostris extrusa]|uniref:Uncharacterized protein n=1 Tax=Caerostris extrusa TaxID=172846 RepID=A0AAV4T4M6_CAEEX|nr:hypothetical protein CEXT_56581 [Caerostris extrusa]
MCLHTINTKRSQVQESHTELKCLFTKRDHKNGVNESKNGRKLPPITARVAPLISESELADFSFPSCMCPEAQKHKSFEGPAE